MVWMRAIILLILYKVVKSSLDWSDLKLPHEHVPYFFYNNPQILKHCKEDKSCPYKNLTDYKRCWGYEKDCPEKDRMSMPVCNGDASRWARTVEDQVKKFWTDADFGYIKYFQDEEKVYCKPKHRNGAKLTCSNFLRHCKAKKILINLKGFDLNSRDRYSETLFNTGDIGGYCNVDYESIQEQSDHKSPLQSWFAELGNYSSLSSDPFTKNNCDIIIDKPTYLIKLDAGINMFHHFCDFVNLYAAMHTNNTFSTDVYIVMWDTSAMRYGDFFKETWSAFTKYPVINLSEYAGKKVCFRDAVFSLLPRMRFGLYYNMPLIPGCHGSSLIRAFSQHVLHRLGITQKGPLDNKIRITLLDRKTAYRNILNQNELIKALKKLKNVQVKTVVYDRNMPFLDQLTASHNSDIFIGMHGAGLTHMLFQPDWAVGFELYNCEDLHCYHDLARLRGIKYLTWQEKSLVYPEDEGHHPTLGAHAKFTNYEFNIKEFIRLVREGIKHVENHPEFKAAKNLKYPKNIKTEL